MSFNATNGGLHNQTRILAQAAIPGGLAAGMGTLYTKTPAGQETTLFYTAGGLGDEWRLTRTRSGDFATFGTNTNYSNAANAANNGGWTFLPGGLIMFYGKTLKTAPAVSTMTVTFPFAFTTGVFSITCALTYDPTNNLRITSSSTSNFVVSVSTDFFPVGQGITWMAIGI